MANYPVNKIRNVCLMGHGGDGKTSLVESLLNIAGVTDRVGKIADGNTVCDFAPEEISAVRTARCGVRADRRNRQVRPGRRHRKGLGSL